jgi:hypothetical protein
VATSLSFEQQIIPNKKLLEQLSLFKLAFLKSLVHGSAKSRIHWRIITK